MTRVVELLAEVEDAFADDPTLGTFDGVVTSEVTGYEVGATETPDGTFATGSVSISVHLRLH